MLGGMDSEPGSLPARRREIDARLDALRARLKKLRERDWDAVRSRTIAPSERLEAAQRHAVEAHDAAAQVLASSAVAFRRGPRRMSASPACMRGQLRQESVTCASMSGKQRSTGLLPPRTGSEPNVSCRFSPGPEWVGPAAVLSTGCEPVRCGP